MRTQTENQEYTATPQVTPAKPKTSKAYGIFAVGVVPLYTLLFACQGNLITTNLSQLGNRPGQHSRFIFWGILCATFFFLLFSKVFDMANYQGFAGKTILLAACASFLICVLLPFVPEEYPRCSQWHSDLAMLASLLTAIVSLIFSLHLRKIDVKLCLQSVLLWAVHMGICVYLIANTGISGLLEVVFIATTCLHTFRIMRQLEAREDAAAFEPVAEKRPLPL